MLIKIMHENKNQILTMPSYTLVSIGIEAKSMTYCAEASCIATLSGRSWRYASPLTLAVSDRVALGTIK
jgi:hypothetical protein